MVVAADGSGNQIWQPGFMEDTLEFTETDVAMQQCKQCGKLVPFGGMSATDIKSREDGTRVITGLYR